MESNVKQSSGVTFDIVLDDNVPRHEPERVLLMKNRPNRKEPLTADEIEKKQKLAEERRQARLEARLKRMHEREESTRKLVRSVDTLLQQQSLRAGQTQNPSVAEVPVMSQREILKTANDVAKGFKEMQRQLLNMDLKVEERNQPIARFPESKRQFKASSRSSKKGERTTTNVSEQKKPSTSISSEAVSKTEGIAFEIPCDDLSVSKHCSKKPAIAKFEKRDYTADSRELAALKLQEKQRKAAERRQKKQEDRVRKTRESREALMELQRKVNIFQQHQAAIERKADPGFMLSQHEAARLAHDIADGFGKMQVKYKTDLERAEAFRKIMQSKSV